MNNTLPENTLSEEIYESGTFPKRYTLLLIMIFSFSLLLAVPWKSLFHIPSLAQMAGCPIQTSPMEFNFLPPGPSFKTLTLPSACTGMATSITLTNVATTLGGFSFSPFGPVINVKANLDQLPLNIKLAIGFGTQNISIYYDKLSLNQLAVVLKKYLQLPLILEGQAKADIRISLNDGALDEYLVDITSNDLNMPSQMISLFKIPDLALKRLILKIQGKKNKALVENFTLGNASNLLIQSKGNLLLNLNYPETTRLDLNVELKLSPELNQEFAILGTLLGNNKVSEGQYKFKLSGNLMSPSVL